MGERMRARARELGWSDAQVARRADIDQRRYANYVLDRNEPDLGTLVRISEILGVTTEFLLKGTTDDVAEVGELQQQLSLAANGLARQDLTLVLAMARRLRKEGGPDPAG